MRVSSCSCCCKTKQLNKWMLGVWIKKLEILSSTMQDRSLPVHRITAVETASTFSSLPPAALQTQQNVHLYVNSDRKEQY